MKRIPIVASVLGLAFVLASFMDDRRGSISPFELTLASPPLQIAAYDTN